MDTTPSVGSGDKMRAEVISVAGDVAAQLVSRLDALPGAVWTPSKYLPEKLHLEYPNGGEIYFYYTDQQMPSGAALYSALNDGEHNAWAKEVFATLTHNSRGDVVLLDEQDNVVRSRRNRPTSPQPNPPGACVTG